MLQKDISVNKMELKIFKGNSGKKLGITYITVKCENCDKEFQRNLSQYNDSVKKGIRFFCTRECCSEWRSQNLIGEKCKAWKGGKAKQVCDNCNKVFYEYSSQKTRSTCFCSRQCKGSYFSDEMSEKWKGGITPLRAKIHALYLSDKLRTNVMKRDKNCVKCNSTKDLQLHHIKPYALIIGEYNIKTIKEAKECLELWNESNCVILCKDCHIDFHKVHGQQGEYLIEAFNSWRYFQ